MFNARGAERRPHVADQEATGVTPISHLLLFHVLHSFIHSFIYFFSLQAQVGTGAAVMGGGGKQGAVTAIGIVGKK